MMNRRQLFKGAVALPFLAAIGPLWKQFHEVKVQTISWMERCDGKWHMYVKVTDGKHTRRYIDGIVQRKADVAHLSVFDKELEREAIRAIAEAANVPSWSYTGYRDLKRNQFRQPNVVPLA